MLYIYYDNITFKDLVQELFEQLKQMNISCVITNRINSQNFLDLYIIFGMNDFNSQILPNNYIVYQLEQTSSQTESNWFNQNYLEYLNKALRVWDYSLNNYQYLKKIGIKNIDYVPIQYLQTLKPLINVTKDIDVLFLGSLNTRRQTILDQLINLGLKVVIKNNIWEDERDQLVARSKLVINIHYYEKSILESVRLSYLLSHGCAVISEVSEDRILDKWHSKFIKLVNYDKLTDTCVEYIQNEHLCQQLIDSTKDYCKHTYASVLPIKKLLDDYGYLLELVDQTINNTNEVVPIKPVIDSSDIFEAESTISKQNEVILKLPKYQDKDLPMVSIVTVTHNRKHIFPMAIRNWQLIDYPKDKLEWIIVDDGDDDHRLTHLLPKSKQIKYHRLQTTGRLSIGQKRNYGVENATHEYIVFMDDDDYYYPLSVYARIGLLLKYPQYDLVGVSHLDIYDVVNEFSARINSPYISEASMGFRKSFWREQKFPDKFHTLGEGYSFIKDRRHKIMKMPSCFNLIALTHWDNYTQNNRSHQKFPNVEKKSDILKVLDLSTRLFIYDLFNEIRKKQK